MANFKEAYDNKLDVLAAYLKVLVIKITNISFAKMQDEVEMGENFMSILSGVLRVPLSITSKRSFRPEN